MKNAKVSLNNKLSLLVSILVSMKQNVDGRTVKICTIEVSFINREY